MPTKKPHVKVYLEQDLFDLLKQKAGEQGMSDYVRGLIERDCEYQSFMVHGRSHKEWELRRAYQAWLSQQAGDFDPLAEQDGDYTFEAWRRKQAL